MTSLPKPLIDSLKNAKGFDESAFINAHLSAAPTSIRLNPFKEADLWLNEKQIPWSTTGKYLAERPSFTLDPLFHAGCYYVQEASSMFIEQALKQTCDLESDLKVLDLCAAPGGKSTLINSIISANSMLVSNEVIKTRVNVLSENLIKWGTTNTYVTNNDPSDFARLQGFFDVIIVDAPCSGSGLFRKDAEAINEWSEANVNLCSQRQQRILADVFPSLKENGIIIYSTCSYSKQENEDVLDWFAEELKLESLKLKVDADWGIVETESDKHKMNGYRFYPNRVGGEGFFIACLTPLQLSPKGRESRGAKGGQLKKLAASEKDLIAPWIDNSDSLLLFKHPASSPKGNPDSYREGGVVYAINKLHEEWYDALTHNLYIRKAGICLGELIRDELLPDHQLAMSLVKNKNIASVEVDKETALKYLRKESITLNSRHGWNLVTYNGHALGWAKVMQNRMNNYYPKEWRIRNV